MDLDTDPQSLRARIAALDDIDRKVLGGLTVLMIAEHDRVKEREWVAERFVQLAVLAHGFAGDSPPDADVAAVQRYAQERMDDVVVTAFSLFVRTAEDLKARGGTYGMDDAKAVVESYVGEVDLPPPPPGA